MAIITRRETCQNYPLKYQQTLNYSVSFKTPGENVLGEIKTPHAAI
jgi:hypothetical protein